MWYFQLFTRSASDAVETGHDILEEEPQQQTVVADFENALQELEKLVEELEKGELSLEHSLRRFERGVELTRTCQKALREAEQKVSILLERDADSEPEPFDRGN